MNYRDAIAAIAPMLEDGVVFQGDLLGTETHHLANGPTFDAKKQRWEVPKSRRIDGINIPKCDDFSKSLLRIEGGKIKEDV